MLESDEHSRKISESLREAVAEALERKRKLGQYAVFWRDGQIVYEGPDAPTTKAELLPAQSTIEPKSASR